MCWKAREPSWEQCRLRQHSPTPQDNFGGNSTPVTLGTAQNGCRKKKKKKTTNASSGESDVPTSSSHLTLFTAVFHALYMNHHLAYLSHHQKPWL